MTRRSYRMWIGRMSSERICKILIYQNRWLLPGTLEADYIPDNLHFTLPRFPDVPGNGTSVTKTLIFMPDVPDFGTSVTICGSRWGGCAGARARLPVPSGAEGRVREERLPRVLEAEKPVGCRQTSIFLLGWLQPHRLCRKHRGLKLTPNAFNCVGRILLNVR